MGCLFQPGKGEFSWVGGGLVPLFYSTRSQSYQAHGFCQKQHAVSATDVSLSLLRFDGRAGVKLEIIGSITQERRRREPSVTRVPPPVQRGQSTRWRACANILEQLGSAAPALVLRHD
jgi:hypothetical protein